MTMRENRGMLMLALAPLAILGLLAFIAIGGLIVMLLWNWLLPALFGWQELGFWQALGLLALCRILFGGFGRGGYRPSLRRRMADRMADRMKERERLRQSMRESCFGPSSTEDKEES